ncbi:MAG TPA: helicase-related protein [Chthoniobacteraceae bacterium]|nr:helicase-related protein [Chthoniobacteraceae bacterium]
MSHTSTKRTNSTAAFSPEDYTAWIGERCERDGLPFNKQKATARRFMPWVADMWSTLRLLPEASGLSLNFGSGNISMGFEIHEDLVIRGRSFPVTIFESVRFPHCANATAFPAALQAASDNASRREPRIRAAVAEVNAHLLAELSGDENLSDEDIWSEVERLRGCFTVNQYRQKIGITVREVRIRSANRRIAEGIALHRFHETFPAARARKREILFIAGPTNSGKTYAAFQKLASARRGVYLAPLRLMAAEFWDRMQAEGVHCSLITGEERSIDPFAEHVSSTIEMLATDAEYDVAVIDEVQMIADKDRGWAWTQAIVGVNAKLVILVGSPDAENLVRAIAERVGEPLKVQRLERLSPLQAATEPLDMGEPVEEGTGFISFSRKNVLSWKRSLGGAECAAVYGALSPEVRREEARRFCSGEAKYVSATDAIGMGLNLPVKTIVFTTLTKWNGEMEITLDAPSIRQIAGRAGRFGHHEVGIVTALTASDLAEIRRALAADPEPLPAVAPIAPHMKMLGFLAQETGKSDLASLLDCFAALPGDEDLFRKADVAAMRDLARELRDADLSLEHQFALCVCPVDVSNEEHMRAWRVWVKAVKNNHPIGIPDGLSFEDEDHTTSSTELHYAEARVRLLAAYRWMHHRLPELFNEIDDASTVSASINSYISKSLKAQIVHACRRCSAALPADYEFGLCPACFRSTRRRRR